MVMFTQQLKVQDVIDKEDFVFGSRSTVKYSVNRYDSKLFSNLNAYNVVSHIFNREHDTDVPSSRS